MSGPQRILRIGVIGPYYPDSFADNIVDAARSLGHEVMSLGSASVFEHRPYVQTLVGLIERRVVRLEQQLQGRVLRRIPRHLDLILNVEGGLHPSIVQALRKHSDYVALWFPDHVGNVGRQNMYLSPYDALFFKEPHMVDQAISMLGMCADYLPEACNPAWHRPIGKYGTSPDFVLAGNLYPYRYILVRRMLADGITLRLYGPDWPQWFDHDDIAQARVPRYIAGSDKATVFRSALGVINTHNPAEFYGVNCRLFEATGSGAVTVTPMVRELPSLFRPGQEVLAYDSYSQLRELLAWIRAEPEKAEAIADAGAGRAHRDHGYAQRLNYVFEKLALT